MNPLRTGPWRLSELSSVKRNGLTVFSCFCCGGGSTMGYKLAGFRVLGGVEIDPQMAAIYRKNHNPEHFFTQPIQEFRLRDDLPKALFELDVLDGSPPCSSFSMAGSREKAWGEKKKFREGQAEQVLDDLFFHFIALAKRLQPKMVVAENVKGLVQGNARGYVKEIFEAFDGANYDAQLFLLDASRMGVPQRRERIFFIARRRDLGLRKIQLSFSEPAITARTAFEGLQDDGTGKPLTELGANYWRKSARGKSFSDAAGGKWFNWIKMHPDRPANTVPATCQHTHWDSPRFITFSEAKRLQTFPDDFDFLDANGRYVCGMSVPPFMMQRVALAVADALRASD